MIEAFVLAAAGCLYCLINQKPDPPASPYRHPSFKPVVHSTISREKWAKHDRPFLGSKLNKPKLKKRKKA